MPKGKYTDEDVSSRYTDADVAPTTNKVRATPPMLSFPGIKSAALTLRDKAVNALPAVGGVVGGLIGGAAGAETGPGAIVPAAAGAAAGGGLGESVRQFMTEHLHPEDKKMTGTEAAKGIGKQAALQGASELLPGVVGAVVKPASAIEKLSFVGNLGPREDIAPALAELQHTEKMAGNQVKTVGDYLNVVDQTKARIGSEVSASLKTPVQAKVTSTMFGTNEPAQIALNMKDGTPFTLKRKFAGKYEAFTQDGTKIGDFSFVRHANGEWKVSGANVSPQFQRRGVASASYDALEDVTGKNFTPSGSQSGAGQRFWEGRNARPPHVPQPATNTVPLGSMEADTTQVSDALNSLAAKHPSEVQMNPGKLQMFKDRALDYQKNKRSYAWLFDRRQVLNEELNRFYSLATPGEQATYLFQHPGFEADKAEADAIRDVIYPQMDKAAGKPAGYYADLQRKYGAISRVGNATKKNLEKLAAKGKVQRGAPMSERTSLSTYASEGGRPGFSLHRLQGVFARPNPAGHLDSAVKSAFGHSALTKTGSALSSNVGREILALPIHYLANPDAPVHPVLSPASPVQ